MIHRAKEGKIIRIYLIKETTVNRVSLLKKNKNKSFQHRNKSLKDTKILTRRGKL